MSRRSVSSSPLCKKPRLSSPTYDDLFAEFDSNDFQALNDIETSLSQRGVFTPAAPKEQFDPSDRKGKRRHAIEDALKACESEGHDDSGIMFINAGDTSPREPSVGLPLHPRSSFPRASGTTSTAEELHCGSDLNATFIPVSMMIPTAGLSANTQRSPSPEVAPSLDHDAWFLPIDMSLPAAFASASAVYHPLESTRKFTGTPGDGVTSPTGFLPRAGSTWASPSLVALEKAKQKLKAWESEIESELLTSDNDQQHIPDFAGETEQSTTSREPLRGVENSVLPETITSASVNHRSRPIVVPPRPFKAPEFIVPSSDSISTTPSHSSRSLIHPIVARSSAAAAASPVKAPRAALTHSSPVTPVRPSPSRLCIPPQTPRTPMPPVMSRSTGSSQYHRQTPQKTRPLGLTPRAHAFSGSVGRPKFVTPFKQGVRPGGLGKDALFRASQLKLQAHPQREGSDGVVLSPPGTMKVRTRNVDDGVLDHSKPLNMITLVDSGLTPQFHSLDELDKKGFDIRLFSLTTVSHFVYYRFNTTNAEAFSAQISFGSDSALDALVAVGCAQATKAWVDNHWSLILWKMIGMACLEPAQLEKRWCRDEVMRQLHYRYKRELKDGSRPALRLITTQDAPPSGPLVLCVSNIFWTDEYVDAEGQLVLAHPELELTDGWYRLRATVDDALGRAVRNNVLKIGRKIACSGARLESSKKDPMEVLDAYENTHLKITGNSTHLAPWHAKLGFRASPFVATLGSLSSDGGAVPLMDLVVMQTFPVGFIEFITKENGDVIREGPRTERDDALEDDRWKDRRSNEAAKLWDELEKKLLRLDSYADKLEHKAGSGFQPTADESPPDDIERMADELEDSEDPVSIIKNVSWRDAGWLAMFLRKKCETDRETGRDEIDRELASSFPPRQVRNFRVLRVKDARTVRKPSWRTAQLTVWDVMSLTIAEGSSAGSFEVGQRYMVTNLLPSQQSAWMGLAPDSEVYLSTRRDSKWKMVN